MPESPIFGGFYQARTLNEANQICINLFPEFVETKTGRSIGALYTTPGLTLQAIVGSGPVRGIGALGTTLYAVSGNQVYSVTTSWNVTLLGTIGTSGGAVSIIQNGSQLVIFDGQNGYLVPGGYPLSGGTLGGPMQEYAVGDTVLLQATNGTQNASAELTVTSVPTGAPLLGGAIGGTNTNYNIGDIINLVAVGGTQIQAAQVEVTEVASASYPLTGGAIAGSSMANYAINDTITLQNSGGTQFEAAVLTVTSLAQAYPLASVTISPPLGTGYTNGDTITLNANSSGTQLSTAELTVTGTSSGAVTSASVTIPGAFTVKPTGFFQSATSGGGTGFIVEHPVYGPLGTSGVPNGVSITSGGFFNPTPALFTQASTSGSGTGLEFINPTFGSAGANGVVTGIEVSLPGSFSSNPTSFTQASTSGSGTGFTLTSPTFGTPVSSGVVGTYTVTLTGAFNPKPSDGADFTGSILNGILTASGITGTIAAGQSLIDFNGTIPATVTIVSGSGSTWTTSDLTLNVSSTTMTTAPAFTQASTSGSGSGLVLALPTFGSLVHLYPLTLPFSGPVSASYQDGFGVVNQSGTDQWWQSNLFDLSYWDALNFSSADGLPDDVVAIGNLHNQFFLIKQYDTEVWANAGLPGFTFQRESGVFSETGCAAPFSLAKCGESLIWLAQFVEGNCTVVMVTGYEPIKISTFAIEYAISQYEKVSDARAYSVLIAGHCFYVLIFPNANATWVYDLSTKLWHSWAGFLNGAFNRHNSNCFSFFNGQPIVGDYLNGNLYLLDQNAQTDNGVRRKWVRSWRALPKAVYDPVRFSALQIDMQTGIGVPDGTNPQVVLDWSDDGGHTWSNERFQSAGKVGETGIRVMFRRLGTTSRTGGLDRIFRLSSTDVFAVGIMAANIT